MGGRGWTMTMCTLSLDGYPCRKRLGCVRGNFGFEWPSESLWCDSSDVLDDANLEKGVL